MQIQTVSDLAQALSLAALKAAPSTPTDGGEIVNITVGNRLEVDDFIHLSRCATTGEMVLLNYHQILRQPLCTLYQNDCKISGVSTDDNGHLVIEIFISKGAL